MSPRRVSDDERQRAIEILLEGKTPADLTSIKKPKLRPAGRTVGNAEASPFKEKILEMHAAGAAPEDIARELGLTLAAVRRVLSPKP